MHSATAPAESAALSRRGLGGGDGKERQHCPACSGAVFLRTAVTAPLIAAAVCIEAPRQPSWRI
eukprot:5611359-Amphidinium_carterae.1